MKQAINAHAETDSDLVGVGRWDAGWRKLRLTRMPTILRYFPRRMMRIFRQYLGSEAKEVLEVGCGGGKWMVFFARQSGQVYGLDYAFMGCQLARRLLVEADLSGRVVCGDVFSAPFKPNSFDLVYSLGVVEHFQDATQIMVAMACLLKPGGRLIVGVPNMNGLMGGLHRLADRGLWLRHVPLSPEDITRLYKILNLEVQYAEYVGTLYLAGPNWNRLLKSERLGALVRIGLAGLETMLTLPLSILNLQLESPHFSPYILVIGQKSFGVSKETLLSDQSGLGVTDDSN